MKETPIVKKDKKKSNQADWIISNLIGSAFWLFSADDYESDT